MSNLRRYHRDGNSYFITNVTFQRMPVLVEHQDLLRQAFQRAYRKASFDLIGWVFLPDHFHIIVDPRGRHISALLQQLKMSFAASYRKRVGWRSGRVWQHRFRDQVIRDQDDMNRHPDYIHYNPVKHGHASSPAMWKLSSFQDYLKRGLYGSGWGSVEPPNVEGEFGDL